MRTLLALTAASEGVTGLAVAIAPLLVVRLLLGAEPSGAGLAMKWAGSEYPRVRATSPIFR
jgi:hypothetical protein